MHRHVELHVIARFPFAVDCNDLSGCLLTYCLAIDFHRGLSAPSGYAHLKRKCGGFHFFVGKGYAESHGAFKWIYCGFVDADLNAVGDFGRDSGRSVVKRRQPSAGCGEPQVTCEFRPPLMKVGCAARITCEDSKHYVGAFMWRHEIPLAHGDHDLIELLVVLPSVEIIGCLSRQGVICHALKPVGPVGASRDFYHLLERIHHLDGSAKFGSLCRIARMQKLVAAE